MQVPRVAQHQVAHIAPRVVRRLNAVQQRTPHQRYPTGAVRHARDLHAGWRPDVLGGCVVISGTAELDPPDAGWSDTLYREIDADRSNGRETVTMQAIPYHLWANRGRGSMTVWLWKG